MVNTAAEHMRTRRRDWSGRKVAELVARTLDTYGDTCHICGKAGADSADHYIPRSRGGGDHLANLRPAHLACNVARGDWSHPDTGVSVSVVCGPDAAAYVDARARGEDLVLDLHRFADAVSLASPVGFTGDQLAVAESALLAALARAGRLDHPVHVWLTDPTPTRSRLKRYAARQWRLIDSQPKEDGAW